MNRLNRERPAVPDPGRPGPSRSSEHGLDDVSLRNPAEGAAEVLVLADLRKAENPTVAGTGVNGTRFNPTGFSGTGFQEQRQAEDGLPLALAINRKLHGRLVRPSKAALTSEVWRFRRRSEAGTLLVVVVPLHRPDLALVAHALKVDRIVLFWDGVTALSKHQAVALRAAFASVDLTLVRNGTDETWVTQRGADPNRIARLENEVLSRLVHEPPRTNGHGRWTEAGASLALDIAEMFGFVRLAELTTPNRGVNVLTYHRVLPIEELTAYGRPQMAMAEPLFRAQLELLSERRGFAPIDSVKDQRAKDKVVITFDDGYEDNYRVALPILQTFSAPACIFVVTALIDHKETLWWDRLGLAMFAWWRDGCQSPLPASVPQCLDQLRSTLAVERAREIISQSISCLNKEDLETRERAARDAAALVSDLPNTRTMLTWEEISALKTAGISIGSHTRHHVPLDELPSEDAARDEIVGAQEDIECKLGRDEARYAALPRGRLGLLSEEKLRVSGFSAVMTTDSGVHDPGSSFFVRRRDGQMLTLHGRHHPAKLRLELTGLFDRARAWFGQNGSDY